MLSLGRIALSSVWRLKSHVTTTIISTILYRSEFVIPLVKINPPITVSPLVALKRCKVRSTDLLRPGMMRSLSWSSEIFVGVVALEGDEGDGKEVILEQIPDGIEMLQRWKARSRSTE